MLLLVRDDSNGPDKRQNRGGKLYCSSEKKKEEGVSGVNSLETHHLWE